MAFRYTRYIFSSPKLFTCYIPGNEYSPSIIETLFDLAFYAMPFLLLYCAYNQNFWMSLIWVFLLMNLLVIRNVWRLCHPVFRQFLQVLKAVEDNPALIQALRSYDFDFAYFPVTYICAVNVQDYVNRQVRDTGLKYYLSYLVAHSIGIRVIYAGLILGPFLTQRLVEGRRNLVVQQRGVRIKIDAHSDAGGSVKIDAIVLDRRNIIPRRNSDILVLCCEGNSSFYEMRMWMGAVTEGYSIIAWNHPGFGGSSGIPYPETELTAVLAVMQYAVVVLGFNISNILVYGWSIGGFSATYLASRFQNIRGLILDATFDHVLPVSLTFVPRFLTGVVTSTVQNHINLDNIGNLENFSGPIRVVRRLRDEIMAVPPNSLQNNRTSHLLTLHVLKVAGIIPTDADKTILIDWVKHSHLYEPTRSDALSRGIVRVRNRERSSQGLMRIARSILREHDSTHNTRIPERYFRLRR